MSDYKLVDAEKLDSDLKDIADCIRLKDYLANRYNKLAFPEEFKSSIERVVNKTMEDVLGFDEIVDYTGYVAQFPRKYMFAGRQSLKTVKLDEGIRRISERMFADCDNLLLSELPETLGVIEAYAFYDCEKIAINKLPDSVASVGDSAFVGCQSLTTMTLSTSLQRLGSRAFSNTSLTSVTFQSTPELITSDVFYDSKDLVTINAPWSEGAVVGAPWGATNATINYNYTGE